MLKEILAEKLDYMHTRRLWHSIFLYVTYSARERSYICINVYPSSSPPLPVVWLSTVSFSFITFLHSSFSFTLDTPRSVDVSSLLFSLFLSFIPPPLSIFASNSNSSHPDVRWTYTRLLSGSLYTLLFALRYFK